MDPSAKRFFIALLVLTLLVLAGVMLHLFPGILTAAVVAAILWPLQKRLVKRVKRGNIAAGLLVTSVLLLLVVPFILFSAFVVRQATEGYKFVNETVRSEGVSGLVDRLPGPFKRMGHYVLEVFPKGQGEPKLQEQGGKAAAVVGSTVVSATTSLLFQAAMMLIALYFFLSQGEQCLTWIDRASPLRRGQTRELLSEVRQMASSVMLSTFATAAIQAVTAGIGFAIARVPHLMFFVGLTFICSIIPVIGATAVVLATAGLIAFLGHPYSGLFLAIYGVTLVGLVDNLVKPLLVKGHGDISGVVIFFALTGGIATFGAIGLIIGPLAVALFLALLRMYRRDVAPA
jgi:predicted PurR-regulated permease PerM